jgi:hypothetical protein
MSFKACMWGEGGYFNRSKRDSFCNAVGLDEVSQAPQAGVHALNAEGDAAVDAAVTEVVRVPHSGYARQSAGRTEREVEDETLTVSGRRLQNLIAVAAVAANEDEAGFHLVRVS